MPAEALTNAGTINTIRVRFWQVMCASFYRSRGTRHYQHISFAHTFFVWRRQHHTRALLAGNVRVCISLTGHKALAYTYAHAFVFSCACLTIDSLNTLCVLWAPRVYTRAKHFMSHIRMPYAHNWICPCVCVHVLALHSVMVIAQ